MLRIEDRWHLLLREDSSRPMILMGAALASRRSRVCWNMPFTLVSNARCICFGRTHAPGFVYAGLDSSWLAQHPDFRYTPVLSNLPSTIIGMVKLVW